MPVVLQVR